MKPQAILFDLDDTLTDRAATIERYAARFLEHFAKSLDSVQIQNLTESIRQADGGGYRPKLEVAAELIRTLPWLQPPRPEALEAFWLTEFPRLAALMSGMRDVLNTLKSRGVRLGIVTNGRGRAQHPKLDALNVRGFMDVILVSEDAGVKKPDPRIFAMALEQFGLEPKHVWMVGDHPLNDVIGARSAGIKGIWFNRQTHSWPDNTPRGSEIQSLPDLLRLLGG